MTYSIVARDAETGELGAAIQSAAFRAGVHTLWVEAGVGAVASQSFSDPSYGPMCLLALRTGATASAALAAATRRDRMSPYRQVGVAPQVDALDLDAGAARAGERRARLPGDEERHVRLHRRVLDARGAPAQCAAVGRLP